MKKIKLLFLFAGCATLLHAQNNAISFNGTSDYIDCGTSFNASAIRTMECWVKFNNFSGNQEILSKSVNSSGIELLLYSNQLAFFCMKASGIVSHVDYPASNLQTGIWYHVAASWEGTKESMQLYVNGVAVGTRYDAGDINSGITNPSGSFKIGQWSQSTETRFFNGSIDEARIWSVSRTAGEIKNGMYGAVAENTAGLLAYYKMNEGTGATVANSSTGSAALSSSTGSLVSSPTWVPSPVQRGSNALSFDGVDDYVKAPANSAYDFTTGTIECWVQPNGLVPDVNATIIANRNDPNGTRYSFHMSSEAIGLWNGTEYLTVPYPTTSGQWYHLAFVCNGATTEVYVNGTDAGTIYQGVGTSVTGKPLFIGTASAGEYFPGTIDEVSIWNITKLQADIQTDMNNPLTGSEAGLVALFSFDQGIASGTNDGLLTAVDGTANNNHATLYNFTLDGTSSNYVGQTMTTLPVELRSFTGVTRASGVELNWTTASETNSDRFEVERSGDGVYFSRIATVTAAGSTSQSQSYTAQDVNPLQGINYYRLRQVDRDGKSKYFNVIRVKWNRVSKAAVRLSPQPMRSTMQVTISGGFSKGSFAMFDAAGAPVKTIAVTATGGRASFTVNRDQLLAGVYFYKLLNERGAVLESGKVMVE